MIKGRTKKCTEGDVETHNFQDRDTHTKVIKDKDTEDYVSLIFL